MVRCMMRCCAVLGLLTFASSDLAAAELRLTIRDQSTGQFLPARVYLQGQDGTWHFLRSTAAEGTAIRYEKQNWNNKQAVEYHTTVSAHPCVTDLADGTYTLTVERGKEFFPESREVVIAGNAVSLDVPLQRWSDMAAKGWYSGETHIHRTIDELRNVLPAEDLNVAFPLSYWVTKGFAPPAAGDKNLPGDIPSELIRIDDTHVIWPRNTEYEIFTVGDKPHTLGALFLLNHKSVFTAGAPPWGPIADKARTEGALLDMDKLDWPFAMMLPPVTGAGLYELANNHIWRTEFGFRQWNSPTPPYLQPPFGATTGNEREWLNYTLGMYYTLLNCGQQIQPTAGTANGVHPVPAGFSRVYVHLPDGFSYEKWLQGLQAGRSFVTTGPMLLATVDGQDPGADFHLQQPRELPVSLDVTSEAPLAFLELIFNGVPVRTWMPQNRKRTDGAYQSQIAGSIAVKESGWLAIRAWEDRPGGRFRFAHTAPWHVEVSGATLRPRLEEQQYLIGRMQAEIERSKGVLPPAALAEYDRALAAYEALLVQDDGPQVTAQARAARDPADLTAWLKNMVHWHRFSPEEVRLVTGLSLAEAEEQVARLKGEMPARPAKLTVLPYPGGRHPRMGFLDGALEPQRETKISVFPPWADGGYVVVDVPEALFTNLGLTYLAHTHVPTIWSKQGTELARLEWQTRPDGGLELERTLPNGIAFGSRVIPGERDVAMEIWLKNGTNQPLMQMRIQTCVMLKAALGFNAQTNGNKLLREPFIAVKADGADRWIITAWEPCQRVWANPPVPCLHSDPKLPDCPPGETVTTRGRLWFYEGHDIESELARLATTWNK